LNCSDVIAAISASGGTYDVVTDTIPTVAVQSTSNLVSGAWVPADFTAYTNITGGAYNVVSNTVPTDEPQTYIRLQITTP
jgi:hypothetical protein